MVKRSVSLDNQRRASRVTSRTSRPRTVFGFSSACVQQLLWAEAPEFFPSSAVIHYTGRRIPLPGRAKRPLTVIFNAIPNDPSHVSSWRPKTSRAAPIL